jgi:hypothetical protein
LQYERGERERETERERERERACPLPSCSVREREIICMLQEESSKSGVSAKQASAKQVSAKLLHCLLSATNANHPDGTILKNFLCNTLSRC